MKTCSQSTKPSPIASALRTLVGLAVVGGLTVQMTPGIAQDARFFRIVGPVAATITSAGAEGNVAWTNQATNGVFNVQTAAALPGGWTDYVQVPASNTLTTLRLFDPHPPKGMVMIPAGSFIMGNSMDPNEGDTVELPLHSVYVSAFYMDKYQVTKALWDGVYNWAVTHGYSFENSRARGRANNHPEHTMMWYDALKWCNARSEKEGRIPAYYTSAARTTVYRRGQTDVQNGWVKWNTGYRLPTETEWEKAARGGASGHRFPWSDADTISHSRANYSADQSDGMNDWTYDVSPTNEYGYHPTFAIGDMPYTSPVGYFAANGYGLYDMAGNVMEWCWDWYTDAYYSSSPDSDPHGPTSGLRRVLRNGGWVYGGRSQRCAARTYGEPDADCMNNVAGFRCALVLYAPVVSPSLPVITSQPTSLSRPPRGSATFSVEAEGSVPLAYQWQLNGLALTGATGSTLALRNVQPAEAGAYRVMVTNSYGAVTSSPAMLEVSSSAVVELWSPLHGSASPVPLGLGDVVSVAAGTSHTVALRSDGTVRAWGAGAYGQTNVPEGLTNVIAIAAGANHTAALKQDGTVLVWGDGLSGQSGPPDGLSNVTAIAAAANHTLALKADGTVVGWGNNSSGQLDIPAGLSDVVAIAAGTDNGFAIKSDHTVVQWGNGPTWQSWQSNMMVTLQLSVAPGRSGIASVTAGTYKGWTLDDDGTAQAWGVLANGGINTVGVSVAASGSLAQNRNSNDDYGLLLAENGNLYNTTGLSVDSGMYIPSGLSNFVAVAAGYKHAAAVMSDGSPHVARPMLRRTAQAGSTVTLNAGLIGAAPLTYQWRLNGVDLANATNRVLMITNVALAAAGEYTCVAANVFGSATNSGGNLTVLP